MGYEIRTLATLASQARQFFTQAVPGALVRLWANTFVVLGKVFALLDFEHEMRRQWLFAQLFASTAEYAWLTRHGFELGLTPDAGTAPTGTITVAAIPGLAIPAGLLFERADGATYSVLAAATASGSSVDLTIQSDEVGAAYDVMAADTLTLVESSSAPFGLGTIATVDPAGISGGVDAEDPETFRARVLYRKRNPPQGGSAADYTEWAGQALGTVKNVYVDSFANDARSVWVCFTVSDQANGLPSDAEVAIVQAYVSDSIRRPITARVFVTAPTPVPLDLLIANLSPFSADTTEAIQVELQALFADEVQPATPSAPSTLYREQIEAAIARATGVARFTLISPAADTTYSIGGQMPILNTIQYQ